jgi:acyl carrier protein
MTREEVFERLNEIFRDVFDDKTITVCGDTVSDDIEEWDSLMHIKLIVAIEGEFHFKFNIGEVRKMSNVGEIVDVIMERASNQGRGTGNDTDNQ